MCFESLTEQRQQLVYTRDVNSARNRSAKAKRSEKFIRAARRSDAKRKNFCVRRKKATNFRFSAKRSEAKKANIFFSKSECFFLIRRKKRKKMLLGEAKKAKTFKKLKRAGKNSRNKAILKILQSG